MPVIEQLLADIETHRLSDWQPELAQSRCAWRFGSRVLPKSISRRDGRCGIGSAKSRPQMRSNWARKSGPRNASKLRYLPSDTQATLSR